MLTQTNNVYEDIIFRLLTYDVQHIFSNINDVCYDGGRIQFGTTAWDHVTVRHLRERLSKPTRTTVVNYFHKHHRYSIMYPDAPLLSFASSSQFIPLETLNVVV